MIDKLHLEGTTFLKAIHPSRDSYPFAMSILGDVLKGYLFSIGIKGGDEDVRFNFHPDIGLLLQQCTLCLLGTILISVRPHDKSLCR